MVSCKVPGGIPLAVVIADEMSASQGVILRLKKRKGAGSAPFSFLWDAGVYLQLCGTQVTACG